MPSSVIRDNNVKKRNDCCHFLPISFSVFLFVAGMIIVAYLMTTNTVYGHGLSRDKSQSVYVSGKQVAVEAIMTPAFIDQGNQFEPTFSIRIFDEKTNKTISGGLDYEIIVEYHNHILLNQSFRSSDGIFLANLIPVSTTSGENWSVAEVMGKNQSNLSKQDRVLIMAELM